MSGKNPKRTDDDLDDVVREEAHRGRRGVLDTSARRRVERQKAWFMELLRANATEDQIVEALTALGHVPGTPAFARLLRLWREYRRAR